VERSRTRTIVALLVAGAIILGGVVWLVRRDDSSSDASSASSSGSPSTTTTTSPATTTTGQAGDGTLTLDSRADYGDEYADGILPVGDGRYVTDAPVRGSVFLCRAPQGGGGGAFTRGPWFVNDDTEYDVNKKVAVEGSVEWDGAFSMLVDAAADTRTITTNDLPRDHTTGVFPVQPDDPAYQYDRNPNSIAEQSLTYTLDATPEVQTSPTCMGNESGVMNTGIALFNAFDAGGRDAGAWEVQDGCDGHPQISHEYHYHTLSKCIADVSVSTVLGFALDGFPITGPNVAAGDVLTTDDLDECHGITSKVQLDGKSVTTYHYVMTQDFPYSVSCFRGVAAGLPRSP
jgi:hypothetical protein